MASYGADGRGRAYWPVPRTPEHSVRIVRLGVLALAAAAFSLACTVHIRDPQLHRATPDGFDTARARSDSSTTYRSGDTGPGTRTSTQPTPIKLHLLDGGVLLLQQVSLDTVTRTLAGVGARFDASRTLIGLADEGHRISIDSVALFESDNPEVAIVASMGLYHAWTVVWGAVTVMCMADPKSCFGSCPTFYVDGEDADRPRAEGFSSSIARRLEARDIDDLGLRRDGGATLTLNMLNEAWETHVVRSVRLQVVPAPAGTDVVASSEGRFHALRGGQAPTRCSASGGDCRTALAALDGRAWHDLADSTDLAATDTMLVEFDAPASATPALLLAARQSFVSTFVLYQTMAWMGREAAPWLARLERGDPQAMMPLAAVEAAIGAIAVEAEDAEGRWHRVARFDEHGPIATDRQLLPLPVQATDGLRRVRLIYAKGNWRIDQLALVEAGPPIEAVRVEPTRALRSGSHAGDVTAVLNDPARTVVTFPGDTVALEFVMPREAPQYALFLESTGYYLEWMRGEWLAEGDANMADMLMRTPREGLRQMAPLFKAREAGFEQNFWASRFGRQP